MRTDSLGRVRGKWTTRSRVACRYARMFNTTLREAAGALGLHLATVSETWRSLYPDVDAYVTRRAMSKKTTRRSVSMSRECYETLVAFAERNGTSAAQVVERGISAVVNGEVELGGTRDPHDLAARKTEYRRAGLTREEMERRIRQRDEERSIRDRADAIARTREAIAAVAAAPPDAGLSRFVRVAVSQATGSLVDDQLERAAHDGMSLTDGEVFDGAINRMLDQVGLEVVAGALCATCLESDLCRCNGHRRAVGR